MARRDPRAALTDRIADALTDRTCVVLVGLPGSGRRSLLARVRARLDNEDWVIAEVAGVPGHPLESLALAQLDPSASPTGGAGGLTASLRALTRLASGGPALLLVHDADLLDEASAAVIGAAATQSDLTVLAAVSPPYPGSPAVDAVTARRETTAMWLPALPFEEVHREIAGILGGDLETDAAGRIYSLSGGLPGIARSVAVEARRHGHLRLEGSSWKAGPDLWTPAMAVVVQRLIGRCADEEKDALRVLAEFGPTDVATVREVLPWAVVTRLDDAGLLRFVQAGGRTLVALFPPLLQEHLRHTAQGARGQQAAGIVAARTSSESQADASRRTSQPALRWSSSPEAAAILGRVIREHAAAQVARRGEDWENSPTDFTALMYVHALLAEPTPAELIERVLAADRSHPSPVEALRLAGWEAMYRALVRGDVERGLAVLADAERTMPLGAAVFGAIGQHIRLIAGHADAAILPRIPEPPPPGSTSETSPAGLGLPELAAADVVRMVRGEMLLAAGRTDDAAADFAAVSPTDPVVHDPDSLVPLGLLCGGDLQGALERAQRQLEIARGTLDRGQIEPHGYVCGLALLLQGKLTALSDTLTGLFAINSPAPLRPASRAGLLGLGAAVGLARGNHRSARSMISQLTALAPVSGPFPLTRAEPAAAALAVAEGAPAPQSAAPAWARVGSLLDSGHFLAAIFDAVWLVDLDVDEERVARLIPVAGACAGTLLPALGAYLEGALLRSPTALLRAADRLRETGALLFATRAHSWAITLLREAGDTDAAAAASSRLRALVASHGHGDDLRTLVPGVLTPGSILTPREQEVARLIADGLSNHAVAQRLVVSERTIDNHVYRMFRKLGITSREELASLL